MKRLVCIVGFSLAFLLLAGCSEDPDDSPVQTITALREINPGNAFVDPITVMGYASPNDGGKGVFVWDPESTLKDNGVTVVEPDNGSPNCDTSDTEDCPGRWLRIAEGMFDVRWFGAIPDDHVNDQVAFDAAIAAMPPHGTLYIPAGRFDIDEIVIGNTSYDCSEDPHSEGPPLKPISIQGEGMASELMVHGDGYGILIDHRGRLMRHISISDLKITGHLFSVDFSDAGRQALDAQNLTENMAKEFEERSVTFGSPTIEALTKTDTSNRKWSITEGGQSFLVMEQIVSAGNDPQKVFVSNMSAKGGIRIGTESCFNSNVTNVIVRNVRTEGFANCAINHVINDDFYEGFSSTGADLNPDENGYAEDNIMPGAAGIFVSDGVSVLLEQVYSGHNCYGMYELSKGNATTYSIQSSQFRENEKYGVFLTAAKGFLFGGQTVFEANGSSGFYAVTPNYQATGENDTFDFDRLTLRDVWYEGNNVLDYQDGSAVGHEVVNARFDNLDSPTDSVMLPVNATCISGGNAQLRQIILDNVTINVRNTEDKDTVGVQINRGRQVWISHIHISQRDVTAHRDVISVRTTNSCHAIIVGGTDTAVYDVDVNTWQIPSPNENLGTELSIIGGDDLSVLDIQASVYVQGDVDVEGYILTERQEVPSSGDCSNPADWGRMTFLTQDSAGVEINRLWICTTVGWREVQMLPSSP
ncbi:MAG: hypothetical protein DWQ07_17330 [Chloroflexi bacterium]|nr:MAG: hypothetical protein DWQ07_17330 [Chloroflexota bacterium]MBL1195168.1 hypothetical protein [Chloroflexota bacterium]NOH12452.1 hypothetical protein [Chloroflexota bacterium]